MPAANHILYREALNALLTDFSDKPHAGDCRALRSYLRKKRQRMARYVRELNGFNKLSPSDRAIYDNFPGMEREIWFLLRSLKKTVLPVGIRDTLPDWYRFLCHALAQPDFRVTQDSLLELIHLFETVRPLTNAEHGLTLALLRAAAFDAAVCALIHPVETGKDEERAMRIESAIQAWFAAGSIDSAALDEQSNRLEQLLRTDSVGVYIRQDEHTRARCRWMTAQAALRDGCDELELARHCLHLAKERNETVAAVIRGEYTKANPKGLFSREYFRLVGVLPVVFALLGAAFLKNPLWALLLWLPCYELCRPALERLALRECPADAPPRLELDGKLPADAPSLLMLSTLLPKAGQTEGLYSRLEELLLACPDGPAGVCLLGDLRPAAEAELDEDCEILQRMGQIAEELNRKYENRLICLVRGRRHSPTGREYSGWERKRGAICALVKCIGDGDEADFVLVSGNRELLRGTKYLLALDYDTGLTPDCLTRLVAVAEHPLNRPVIDRERGRVSSGWGVWVPSIVPELNSSVRSPFSRALCGAGGISSYGGYAPELYQSLRGSTIFTGKGLLNVEACGLLEGRFPPETVLSHDILEGGILRAGFAGDVELTDCFPPDLPAYFKRMHRWLRGDFQNLRYAFGCKGNPLNATARFQVWDNLRRALLPVFATLSVIFAGFSQGRAAGVLLAASALAVMWPSLYSLWRMLVGGAFSSLALRFYSGILPKSGECLCRAGMLFLLLPRTAWVTLDAAARGIWRRFVSHRNMLEWAPASMAGGGGTEKAEAKPKPVGRFSFIRQNLGHFLLAYLPHWCCGALLLFGTRTGHLVGILLLAAPLVLEACQFPTRGKTAEDEPLPPEAKERMLGDLRAMLSYYDDYAAEAEHWLPPDNMQVSPAYAVARRTSPTNIGMMLLSYLTARDCGVISSARLFEVVGRVLDTLERMEKFHGNLYNWYDTATLALLPPGFVSTVDSGNLLCCLVALAEGLCCYQGELGADPDLPGRCAALVAEADLSVFYDKRKRLFSVGWDSAAQCLAGSHYDMLMSEARMTSYLAVARREVPAAHWAALSRAMSRQGLHAGPLSWTGTMFEYYMPELLLHCRRGSIGWEALAYCLTCQKRRARKKSKEARLLLPAGLRQLPWGISESGIYAFDGALNYQYNPNGVQSLARKQGQDETYVAAPYASYLVLSRDWRGVLENLNRFEHLGARGRYGYYEAVDFTGSRVGQGGYQVVRSFMAHHIGMSVVAIGNALNGNRMQQRFLRGNMRRMEVLLSEKISGGEYVFQGMFRRKRKTLSIPPAGEYEYAGHLFPQQPRVRLLSNAELTTVASDVGAGWLRSRRVDLTRRTGDLLHAATGTFAYVWLNGEVVPLTYAPAWRADVAYEAADCASGVLYTAQTEQLSAKTEVRVHHSMMAEQRFYTLQNRTGEPMDIVLLVTAEPSVFPREDDDAHLAFSKLFLRVEFDSERKAALVTRRKRGGHEPHGETYVLLMGFADTVECDFLSSRSDLYERTETGCPAPKAFTELPADSENNPEPCAAFRVRMTLQPHEIKTAAFFTCVGGSPAEAGNVLSALRREAAINNGVGIDARTAARPRLEPGSLEQRVARTLLPQVLLRKRDSSANLAAVSRNGLPLSALWRFGISGDFPIALCEIYADKEAERIAVYAACHSALRLSFVEYDLVFLYSGHPATLRAIREGVEAKCGQGILGQRAGVHILDKAQMTPEQVNLLTAAACHIATRSLIRIEAPAKPYHPLKIQSVGPASPDREPELTVEGGFFSGPAFVVTGKPYAPWCHILANPTFGTLVSDRALGFTWAVNSRENKLTPWHNDPLRDNTGERILLRTDKAYYDLVNGSLPEFSAEVPGIPYARYRGHTTQTERTNGIASEVKVTVPARGMIKYIDVTLENLDDTTREIQLSYYTEPCLGVTRDHARLLHMSREETALLVHNPANSAIRTWMALSAGGTTFFPANDRPAFYCGEWEQAAAAVRGPLPQAQDPCAALTVKHKIPAHGRFHVRFCMSFSTTRRGALELLRLQPAGEYSTQRQIQVQSGDKAADIMANWWLPWQISACRMYGRTGFYQNGGAYGFRDQLQDVSAFLLLSPESARRQILRCCAVQFEEGDVLHWWHVLPRTGAGTRGVRTRYSDDLVWLPDSVARYIEVSGDSSILEVKVPYLRAPELSPQEKDRYLEAEYGEIHETVYGHCKRALARASRLGRHGLVKIGGGDWNDGYNQVGALGEGESVWLTQFLALVLRRFAPLCRAMGEAELASRYETDAQSLLTAVDAFGWDGDWYLRGYYDNGNPMGSRENDECKIDSLPQSFSVLSGMTDDARRGSAIRSAIEWLVDDEKRIIRLFAPPFEGSEQEPGYVKAYPAGVRENGGQYTHAAVWLAIAACENGMTQEFRRLTALLNPALRCQKADSLESYRLEPYYLAGDVSLSGRGGWSLYTGAAGWYYRLLVEYRAGLCIRAGKPELRPFPPEEEQVLVAVDGPEGRINLKN